MPDRPPSFALTILGAGPACPNPGDACAGYLLRHGETAVLMDCGSGVVPKLRQQLPVTDLEAVVISHFHADHYFDIIPLYYGVKYARPRRSPPGSRKPLYVPPGGRDHLRRFGEIVGGSPEMLDDVFDVREYALGPEQSIGPFRFTFHRVQHYIPSHAMRITLDGGPLLVYSSDVGPCDALVEAAGGADLFLCESTILSTADDEIEPERRGHMTAGEAGAAARAAGARRLLLTHCPRDGDGLDARHLAAATANFDGPVELARPGETYLV